MLEPVVKLRSGFVRGIIEKHIEGFSYYAFKGIPYAEPPVGELRFEDPIPIKKWTEIIDCKNYGPISVQCDLFAEITSYDEDCLYLNIFTRSINDLDTNTPVIVIIHGGGFMFGSSDDSYCGPDYLIRKNIVIVTANYRLGVLGFLDLQDTITRGNQGLKDLLLVLRWIQQNIRGFGGNPNNVTVFGVGAGGAAAHYLALSPLTKGLIHKVISQSSVIYSPWVRVNNPKSVAIKLCSFLGKQLFESKEILKFLKMVDVKKLLEAQERLRQELNYTPFGLTMSSSGASDPFMPEPLDTIANRGVHLPYLVGCNAQEGLTLLLDEPSFRDTSRKDYFKICNFNFGAILKYNSKDVMFRHFLNEKQVKRLYYKSEMVSENNLDKLVTLASDFLFLESIHRFVRVQSEQSSASTYLYRFGYDTSNSFAKSASENMPGGVCHCDELPYLFKMRAYEEIGLKCLEKATQDYRIMEQLTEMWANFATYGRPTIDLSELIPVHWQPLADGTVLRYLNIDQDITMQSTLNVDVKLSSAKKIKVEN